MLTTLMVDISTDFLESLDAGVRANYEQTKENIIRHYDKLGPEIARWKILTERKQNLSESIS